MNPAIFEMECNPAAFGNHNMVNPLRKSRCIECIKPHGFGGKPLEVVPMDAVVPTGVCGGAGKHMVLFTILPLPRLLAVIVPALGAFDPACEAGRASGVRPILPPFLRCGGTVFRRPAVLVSCVRTVPGYAVPVFKEEFERVFLRHLYMVNPVKEHILIKLLRPQNIRTGFHKVLVVDRPSYRTASADLLFLFAAAVPKLHQSSVRAPVVHIADAAMRALDLPGKAAGIETLIRQRAKFPAPFHLLLHVIKSSLINDSGMRALHIILRKLTPVLPPVLGDGVCDKLFLQEQAARISDVRKDNLEVGIHPAAAVPRGDALGGKLPLCFQP